MRLTDILDPGCIKVPMAATDKVSAIRELVDLLAERGKITDAEAVFESVMAREQLRSTGIGNGLAVPHGKSPACPSLVMALGKPSEPIDFGAKDGKPVDVIALLVSPPDQTGPHIQALARISRLMLMEKFRSALSRARTAEEVWGMILGQEG